MSLRVRLLIILVLVAGIGLVAAEVVTYVELRSSLISRLDNDLDNISAPAATELVREQTSFGAHHDILSVITGSEAYVELDVPNQPSLHKVVRRGAKPAATPTSEFTPKLPLHLKVPPYSRNDPAFHNFTVASAQAGGPDWRIAVSRSFSGGTVIVGATLTDIEATLNRLRDIEAAITALILLAGTLAGVWLVGLGLRPLRSIERTAKAISQGDLTRRVAVSSPRTEVGRLGETFNTMLGQIEASFEARAASEERLRQFVADASHELRTPLTSIRGYAELYGRVEGRDSQVASRAVSRIEQEADRMSALVDDLVLLARMDGGRAVELEPVDVAVVVADSVEAARATEPDRPLTLERPDRPVLVRGDHHRLRQVIDNLLANVRAHTPVEAACQVRIRRLAPDGVAGGRVRIEVADEGPGLSPEQTRRVFERFYRADASRSRARGGSGLGLAIVASIVEAHHGTVGVTSEPGRGTTVYVELPAMVGGVRPPPARPPGGARPAPPAPTATTETPKITDEGRVLDGAGPLPS